MKLDMQGGATAKVPYLLEGGNDLFALEVSGV